jgi:glucokinase
VDNDCNLAALAEARFGAGRGQSVVFYVTVGTGVGGGLVVNGRRFGSTRPAIAEIGHLRPGPQHQSRDETVESLASGWGIVSQAIARLEQDRAERRRPRVDQADGRPIRDSDTPNAPDHLLARCGGDANQLTAEIVARAAQEGEPLARDVLVTATKTLGWAIAQVITLLAPDVVVLGGGVAKIDDSMFFDPLIRQVQRYVFPPLADSYQVVPAALGDVVVVHGALALAAEGEDGDARQRPTDATG